MSAKLILITIACVGLLTTMNNCISDGDDDQNEDGTEQKDARGDLVDIVVPNDSTNNSNNNNDGQTTTSFSDEEIAKANTAKDANIDEGEKKTILLINLARLDGKRFWEIYAEPSLKNNSSKYVSSLKEDLAKTSGLEMLAFNEGLYAAATFHAEDMGTHGTVSHNSSDGTSFSARLKKYYSSSYVGENCSYGFNDPLSIVLQLLVDEGIETLGHRENILNKQFKAIGVSIKPHSVYRYNCVQDFGNVR